MSHELYANAAGRTSMAFVGEKPWHGLGQELTVGASLDTWATEAGMDYRVCRSRVRFGADADPQVWDDRHVLFRSDTKAPLAVVSDRYKIVQPAEVLEFFRDVTSAQGATLETAGVMFGGARYWALAKLPLDFALAGGDKVNGYLMLATSADGSIATTAKITSIRVVCNNTLTMARGEIGKNAVKVDLGIAREQWDAFASQAEALASKRLTKREAVECLISALGDEEEYREALGAGKSLKAAVSDQPNARAMGEIVKLYNGAGYGSSLASSDGTAWGLVNAATQYYDHAAGRSQDARLASAWFGPNEGKKDDVLSAVVAATGSGSILDAMLA